MSGANAVSVEEYLSTSYEPDCDYVDGELEDRNVGEKSHSKALGNVCFYLRSNYPALCVFPTLRIRVSATRYRVPDVCVTLAEPDEDVFTEPPFLCVEILSPEDRAARIQSKIADYQKFGVRYIWVIDSREREAFVYTASSMREVDDGVLRTSDPDIAVPLSALFDKNSGADTPRSG